MRNVKSCEQTLGCKYLLNLYLLPPPLAFITRAVPWDRESPRALIKNIRAYVITVSRVKETRGNCIYLLSLYAHSHLPSSHDQKLSSLLSTACSTPPLTPATPPPRGGGKLLLPTPLCPFSSSLRSRKVTPVGEVG